MLYTRDPARFAQLTAAIEKARADRDAAELRWLELAEQADALGSAQGLEGAESRLRQFVVSRFVEDGSYLRVQEITLGYRLPETVTARMMIESARLYVNGTNLFSLTDYSGYTPELTGGSVISSGIDLGTYPTMRTLSVGVDLGF